MVNAREMGMQRMCKTLMVLTFFFWFCIQVDYLARSNVPLTKLEAVGFTCDTLTALEVHLLGRKKRRRKNEKKKNEKKEERF